jgi:hypothetical protein
MMGLIDYYVIVIIKTSIKKIVLAAGVIIIFDSLLKFRPLLPI